jgi:hypothetical protein
MTEVKNWIIGILLVALVATLFAWRCDSEMLRRSFTRESVKLRREIAAGLTRTATAESRLRIAEGDLAAAIRRGSAQDVRERR